MLSRFFAVAAFLTFAMPAAAQENLENMEIVAEELAPGIAVMFGPGGNLAVSYGEDGTVLIDDQFAPLSDKIASAIEKLGGTPVEYLINTHWHYDHAGGNENFANAGATILAHDAVRHRLATGGVVLGNDIPPDSKAALPVVTYDRGLTLHLNDDTIDVIFLGGGHTDGDSIVRWREDNVIHLGDLWFNLGGWPFVDLESGGDVIKLLYSLDTAFQMMDDDTIVIPGHGPVSNAAELRAYRNVIGEAVTRVRALKGIGKTLEESQLKKPLDSFDRREDFITNDLFIETIWVSLD